MPQHSNEPTPRRKVRSALLFDLQDLARGADPGPLGHTADPGVQEKVGLRPRRDALRRRDGQFAASDAAWQRFEMVGSCACIAAVLFTVLTELPILWLAEVLR